jgi:hypothetical protein
MTLTTLPDMRELVERHLSTECRERDTWRHVAAQMKRLLVVAILTGR